MPSWSRLVTLLLLLALAPGAASAASESAAANSPTDAAEWQHLAADHLPADWAELLAELAEPRRLRADFVEQRQFSFRRQSVALEGELRFDPAIGLSLHYTGAEPHTLLIQDDGVWLRDARGRVRRAPAAATEQTRPLLGLLHFDVPQLLQNFAVFGRRDGDRWELRLENEAGRADKGVIHLRGQQHELRTLVLEPTARRRLTIELHDVVRDATFTPEERARYLEP